MNFASVISLSIIFEIVSLGSCSGDPPDITGLSLLSETLGWLEVVLVAWYLIGYPNFKYCDYNFLIKFNLNLLFLHLSTRHCSHSHSNYCLFFGVFSTSSSFCRTTFICFDVGQCSAKAPSSVSEQIILKI